MPFQLLCPLDTCACPLDNCGDCEMKKHFTKLWVCSSWEEDYSHSTGVWRILEELPLSSGQVQDQLWLYCFWQLLFFPIFNPLLAMQPQPPQTTSSTAFLSSPLERIIFFLAWIFLRPISCLLPVAIRKWIDLQTNNRNPALSLKMSAVTSVKWLVPWDLDIDTGQRVTLTGMRGRTCPSAFFLPTLSKPIFENSIFILSSRLINLANLTFLKQNKTMLFTFPFHS